MKMNNYLMSCVRRRNKKWYNDFGKKENDKKKSLYHFRSLAMTSPINRACLENKCYLIFF